MKYFLVITVCSVFAAAMAADVSILPHHPWKEIGPNEYSINFDGGKSWPSVEVKSKNLKPETYYKVSFEARDSSNGNACTQIALRDQCDGKPIVSYIPYRATDKYTPFLFYFKPCVVDAKLSFTINPGASAKIDICNLSMKEANPSEGNLLGFGDFESGNDFHPYSDASAKQLSIVPSPRFFSGEKSLKVTKEANRTTDFTTNDLPAVPGKKIVVKFWAKSANGIVPAHMILDFMRNDQNRHLYQTYDCKIEPEWQEYSYEYSVPTDLQAYSALKFGVCKLRFGLLKSTSDAEVYFDNVKYNIQ